MSMHYIAVLEDAGADHAVGVWFPDLKGCFSAGDTFDEAVANAAVSAELWLEALDGRAWPVARSLSEMRADPSFVDELSDFKGNAVFVAIPVRSVQSIAAE